MNLTTIWGTTNNKYIDSAIDWYSTPNTEGNYSDVTATLFYKRNNTGYVTEGEGNFSLNIGGEVTSVTDKNIRITEHGWTEAITATARIYHDSDGSKSINISATGKINYDKVTLKETHCSGTAILDTIPRASVPSLSSTSFTVGNDVFVYSNRASTSFYHSVWVKRKDTNDWRLIIERLEGGFNLNIQSINNTFYELCPSSAYAEMELCLGTYSDDNTLIGDYQYLDFTIYIADNSTTKPTAVASFSPVSSLSDTFNGLYIQGKTQVKADFSGSYANARATLTTNSSGASVYWQTPSGETYRTATPYSNEVFTDVLTKSGNQSVSVKVRDSRGFSSELVDASIYVHPYEKPSIVPLDSLARVICERKIVTDSDTGVKTSYLKIKAKRIFSPVVVLGEGVYGTQKNFSAFEYRVDNGSWQTLIASDAPFGNQTVDVELEGVIPDVKQSYTVQLRAYDDIGGESNARVMTFDIPTERVTYHLKSGGKGLALGKYAEEDDLFECDWNARFNKDVYIGENIVANHVISEGIDGIWKYRKWKNGEVECWGVSTHENVPINIAWGTLFESQPYVFELPTNLFIDTPQFDITLVATRGVLLEVYSEGTKTATPHLCAVRPNEETADTLNISIVAYGRWK